MNLQETPSYDLSLVRLIIDFFTAKQTNPEKFNEIKDICGKGIYRAREGVQSLNSGDLCIVDFATYVIEKKIMDGVPTVFVHGVIKRLVEHDVLMEFTGHFRLQPIDKIEFTCREYAKFLYTHDLIVNVIHEWPFIANRYSDSVFIIELADKCDDISVGTGFYTVILDQPVIITNRHVLENAAKVIVKNKNDDVIAISKHSIDVTRDLGFIVLEERQACQPFLFGANGEILSEILTIGYPAVPMTKRAYQLFHRGEINSFVEDYDGNMLFLFSAKTTAGNSGSPVINRFGLIEGIVTEELFERSEFQLKGRLPYYAAIPTSEILKGVKEAFPSPA